MIPVSKALDKHGGGGGFIFPTSLTLIPGSHPIFVGSSPFSLFWLQNIVQCCIIFPISPASHPIFSRPPYTPLPPLLLDSPPCPPPHKRVLHFHSTLFNIIQPDTLNIFGHPAEWCWMVLSGITQSLIIFHQNLSSNLLQHLFCSLDPRPTHARMLNMQFVQETLTYIIQQHETSFNRMT